MRAPTKSLIAVSISGFLLLGACQGSSGGGGDDPDARPGTDAAPGTDGSGNPDDPDAQQDPAAALWRAISGANDYKGWTEFPGHEGVVEYTGHGATHRRAFVNTTAGNDLAGLPDGSIVVKENLTSDSTADLAAITVMQKQGDTWFWAKFSPTGVVELADTTEGLAGTGCVTAACHGDMAASENDFVFLNAEAQTAATIYAAMIADDYTTWVGFGVDTPVVTADTTGGLHGGPFLRTFINDVAAEDQRQPPDESILVLENLNTQDPTAANALATITVMKSIAGIDIPNKDWFYARLGADGKVQFAGTLGQNNAYCASGACHGDAELTGGDFIYRND